MTAAPAADEPRPPRPAAAPDALAAFVRDALRSSPPGGLLAISIPAPVAPIDAPLRALRRGPSWVFAGEGPKVATLGTTRLVRLRGEDRFVAARAASDEIFGALRLVAHADADAPPPRLFAGFAFAPGAADVAPWEAFGDGLVTLPRWTYSVDGARASLTLILEPGRAEAERLALCELEAMLGALDDASRAAPRTIATPRVLRTDELSRGRWTAEIDRIRGAIAQHELAKVVAARRSVLATDRDLDALDVLARLDDPRASTTRFLARAGSTTFLGASPEHLFVQRGAQLSTEALAGSIAADAPGAPARLLESAKDREEHRLVVQHLVERLAPLSARVSAASAPQVRRLPSVLHLRTPIEAELRPSTHPLDVLAALHPTPAVGGVPAARAVPWITTHEPAQRGWYSAPLGWIDARGDAEFLVALRCGVVQGGRAWLWAGAGIVAGSEAASEWDETALKLRPMLRALGVAP